MTRRIPAGMRARTAALLCGMVLASNAFAQRPITTSPPAGTCDVINEAFCFALSNGDSATLSVPVDFRLYRVTLRSGLGIIVYDGAHPEQPGKAHSLRFSGNGVTLYTRRVGEATVADFYYEKIRETFTSVVHVRATYESKDLPAFRSFMGRFRACDSPARGRIDCGPAPIFVEASERL